MTCEQAQSKISAEGAVILRYRSTRDPSLPLYDRYVAYGSYCEPNEYAASAYVPTADTQSCVVLVCKDRVDGGAFFPLTSGFGTGFTVGKPRDAMIPADYRRTAFVRTR